MKKGVFIFICLLLAVPCAAEIITVDDDWPYDFNNIQDAIDYADWYGDIIVVFPGTYTGEGNRDIDFHDKAVIVRSADPNDPYTVAATIIDCEQQGRGFYFGSGEDANSVIDGLTITNGSAHDGGGIYCHESSPTITNCTITENLAQDFGGGIGCCWPGSPTITNCTINGNVAHWGGGGGIGCWLPGSPTITNCVISGNATMDNGGGLYQCYGSITHCTISGNTANDEGGGLFDCDGPITNCTINGNVAHWGGGLYYCGPSPITNCTISGNVASKDGGGLYYCDGPITNCTISGNVASEEGGGLYRCDDNEISNCIIWYNSPGDLEDCAWPSYSCFPEGDSGHGNINTEPGFVLFDDDYHLIAGSPCIDAGDNTAVPPGVITDIDGNPRFYDDANTVDTGRGVAPIVDMGAYEYNDQIPYLAVSPSAVKYIYFWGDSNPSEQTLSIANSGGATLNWAITETCGWLEVEPSEGSSTGEIDEVTLRIDVTGLAMGSYNCKLTISDLCAVNSPKTVQVNLVIGCALFVPRQYATIQAAIDAAGEGDTVIVDPNTYYENINFMGKAIKVRCSDPDDWEVVKNTLIDGNENGSCVVFDQGEGNNSILEGFTLTNGTGTDFCYSQYLVC